MIRSRKMLFQSCFLAAIVAASFFCYVFNLDTYPAFYEDEPFFNTSAVRVLEGRSFSYEFATDAPHSVSVWAYHAPFFFRTQVVTMKLFGISHFSCRIPSFLCAHLAVLLLSLLLLRFGTFWGACFLSIGWFGDRALQEVLLGRPEGVCLFLITCGAALIIRGALQRDWNSFAIAGVMMGAAVGFNPGGAYFGLASAVSIVLVTPRTLWLRAFMDLMLGALLSGLVALLFWLPDLFASYEQFTWYVHLSTVGTRGDIWSTVHHMSQTLNGSRFWVLFLVLSSALWAIPSVVRDQVVGHSRMVDKPLLMLRGVAAVFSIAGVFMYVSSSRHPYYFSLLSVWPMVLIATFLNFGWRSWGRSLLIAAWCAVAVACWVPSLFWNAMRCRESWIWRTSINKRSLVETLQKTVPHGVEVMGDPSFFIAAHDAALRFTPLAFYATDTGINPPADAWLALTPRYVEILKRSHYSVLDDRKLVADFACFPENQFCTTQCLIYGPKHK